MRPGLHQQIHFLCPLSGYLRQGLFINRVEAALRKCIAESDPAFENDVVRKVVLSFCVQGCYYTFTSYCGQMDETRLVALLASIARAAQKIRM